MLEHSKNASPYQHLSHPYVYTTHVYSFIQTHAHAIFHIRHTLCVSMLKRDFNSINVNKFINVRLEDLVANVNIHNEQAITFNFSIHTIFYFLFSSLGFGFVCCFFYLFLLRF